MSEDEKEIEQLDKILKVVKEILDFNNKNSKTRRFRFKNINTRSNAQQITKQLNAGNNSEKLKNEIRQLLYSLYRTKKLTKNVYKSLVDTV